MFCWRATDHASRMNCPKYKSEKETTELRVRNEMQIDTVGGSQASREAEGADELLRCKTLELASAKIENCLNKNALAEARDIARAADEEVFAKQIEQLIRTVNDAAAN